ncbi:hypothetical protein [Ruegeria faecimaris]|uniref:Uncharacterized protein n=1 Tax=Ruegeria faecimaris TaxID=686389 RepID=A0A521E4I4_9RHOB|nr:hypothetical protein [Ruegeria faecimaris]SMO78762.1 hypothetical protein SAMN06265380_10974 [Ruegeria faecimaris]
MGLEYNVNSAEFEMFLEKRGFSEGEVQQNGTDSILFSDCFWRSRLVNPMSANVVDVCRAENGDFEVDYFLAHSGSSYRVQYENASEQLRAMCGWGKADFFVKDGGEISVHCNLNSDDYSWEYFR